MTPTVKIKVTYSKSIKEPVYLKTAQSEPFISPIPKGISGMVVMDRHYSYMLIARIMCIMRYYNDPCCEEYCAQAVSDILNHTRGLSPYHIQHMLELDDTSTLELLELLYQLEKDVTTKFAPNVNLRDVMYYIDEGSKTLLLILRREK